MFCLLSVSCSLNWKRRLSLERVYVNHLFGEPIIQVPPSPGSPSPGSLFSGSLVSQVHLFSRLSYLQVYLLCEFLFLKVSSSPGFFFSIQASTSPGFNFSASSLFSRLTLLRFLFTRFSFLKVHTSPDFFSPGSLFSRFQLLQVFSSPGSNFSRFSLLRGFYLLQVNNAVFFKSRFPFSRFFNLICLVETNLIKYRDISQEPSTGFRNLLRNKTSYILI